MLTKLPWKAREDLMKPYLSVGLASLIWGTFVCFISGSDPRPQTPTDEFRALITKYQHAQEEYEKAYREAKTYSERRKLEQERRKLEEEALPLTNEQKYAADFVRLMEKYPKDEGVIDAYLWLLDRRPFGPEFTKATQIITDNQIESEQMARVCRWMADHKSSSSNSLLWQLVKESPHREVQGLARHSPAHQFNLKSEIPVYPYLETLIRSLGNSADGESAKEITATAETLLEEVVANYGQITIGTSTLDKIAASELLEIRQLSLGKTP